MKTKGKTQNSKFKILHFALCIMNFLILSSCDHKDLCYEEDHMSHLRVAYDWSNAPEASPAGMCVFFYSEDRPGEYHRFDFKGTDGGEVDLPVGRYRIITYNNDTEAVQFSGQGDFDSHKAFTRTGDILEPLYGNGISSTATSVDNERVVITPDNLWGCTATDIEVTKHGVTHTFTSFWRSGEANDSIAADLDQVITLAPADLLCHYSFEVRNVKNIQHISKISAAISGMSGSMNISSGELDTERVTLPLPASVNAQGDEVTGAFLTFGHHGTGEVAHKMSFFVVMDDGKKYNYKDAPNLDVTQQVDTAADRRHVHIIIDGLDLPSSATDNADMMPSVDDWGVKEEDLKI